MYYRLINYFDVWKDETGSWTVNDQCFEDDEFYITDDTTDKEICTYLKNAGYLNTDDMRRLTVIDGINIIEVYQKKELKPLFGLLPNI